MGTELLLELVGSVTVVDVGAGGRVVVVVVVTGVVVVVVVVVAGGVLVGVGGSSSPQATVTNRSDAVARSRTKRFTGGVFLEEGYEGVGGDEQSAGTEYDGVAADCGGESAEADDGTDEGQQGLPDAPDNARGDGHWSTSSTMVIRSPWSGW